MSSCSNKILAGKPLAKRVALRNLSSKVYNEKAAEYAALLEPFVGKKIVTVDGKFTGPFADVIAPYKMGIFTSSHPLIVEACKAGLRNVSVSWFLSASPRRDYDAFSRSVTLHITVTASGIREESEGSDSERDEYDIGKLSNQTGELVSVRVLTKEGLRKTNHKAADIYKARRDVLKARAALREAEGRLHGFGEYDPR